MHPILFQLGPLTLYSYGAMLALGAGLGLIVLTRLAAANDLDSNRVSSIALWVLLTAIAGSRLVFVLLEPEAFIRAPWRVFFFWEGGLVFYGGVAAGLITGILLARRWQIPLLSMIDCFGPALALGQAFGRIGCFLAGCCFGLPWEGGVCAVVFTDPHTLAPPGLELHPTQLYSSAALFVIFGISLLVWRKRRFAGQVFFTYGLLHGVARVIIEQFRGDWRGEALIFSFTPTALFALGFALFSAAMLVYLSSRQNR
jgi:phosphatidylglycerol:prolipoprotein diacylglycerol transferase